jgi:hypothetical protein
VIVVLQLQPQPQPVGYFCFDDRDDQQPRIPAHKLRMEDICTRAGTRRIDLQKKTLCVTRAYVSLALGVLDLVSV